MNKEKRLKTILYGSGGGTALKALGGETSLRGFPLAKASAPAKPGLGGLWLTLSSRGPQRGPPQAGAVAPRNAPIR